MTDTAWIAVGGLILTASIQALGLVIWGSRLTQRVKTLEDEVAPLKRLLVQVARLEVKQDGLLEQLKDLNASIRWMRQPAENSTQRENVR
jgi:hypothetical protein